MDRIDHAILAELQRNARLKTTDLADKVGLSATPCARRIAALENDGVIKRYAAVVEQSKVGLPVSIFVSVALKEQSALLISEFEASVANFEEVMECYLMTGSQDFLLRIVAADLHSYERFLQDKLTQLPNLASIRSRFALRQSVQRSALPTA